MATPQEALAAAYGSWNAGDLDGYLSLYDEGIALHGYSPEPMNKDQVRGFYQGIFSAFGTPKLEFHEVLWDGDVATVRFAPGAAVGAASIDGKPVLEVGMIGREGMFGAQLALNVPTQPLHALVQGAGSAWRITSTRNRA